MMHLVLDGKDSSGEARDPRWGFPISYFIYDKIANVACLCCYKIPMSPVDLKKLPCRISLKFSSPCYVVKIPCRHVEFKIYTHVTVSNLVVQTPRL